METELKKQYIRQFKKILKGCPGFTTQTLQGLKAGLKTYQQNEEVNNIFNIEIKDCLKCINAELFIRS